MGLSVGQMGQEASGAGHGAKSCQAQMERVWQWQFNSIEKYFISVILKS